MSTVVALHLGSLHPVEQLLTLVLAFGPFVVLGIVVVLRRRADEAAAARADDGTAAAATATGSGPTEGSEPGPQRER